MALLKRENLLDIFILIIGVLVIVSVLANLQLFSGNIYLLLAALVMVGYVASVMLGIINDLRSSENS